MISKNKLVEEALVCSLAAALKPFPQQSLLRDGLRSRGGKAGLCSTASNGDHKSNAATATRCRITASSFPLTDAAPRQMMR